MTYFDAHCHTLFAGRELQGAVLHKCQSPAELILEIKKFISLHPQLFWFDLSAVARDFEIDRWILDEASTEFAIVVHTADHHSICVNSRALEIASFDLAAPEVEGGRFEVTEGLPNGWIHEYVAMQLIYQHQPKPTVQQDLAALELAQNILLEHSISRQTEAWIDPGMPQVYIEALRQEKLKIKTELAIRVTPENTQQEMLFAVETRSLISQLSSELLTANSVKLFLDGVHSSNTAWLKSDSSTKGIWQPERLLKTASEAVAKGFNLHFHACGDAAVRQALDVVQQVRPNLAVIAHADLIDPADLPELAAAAIIINSTPVWAEKAPAEHFNYRGILDAGIRLCFGSDWPVSQPNMQSQIEAAVNYRNLTFEEARAAAKLDF
ncbi:MAG: amidohydrolase [Micrococcales bacterium]